MLRHQSASARSLFRAEKTKKSEGEETAAAILSTIGGNIRRLRKERLLTLQRLARLTGLSPSMLSQIERGKSAPSIGTLVAIASALDTQTSELLNGDMRFEAGLVSRVESQRIVKSSEGVVHRIVKNDPVRRVEIVVNEFEPGAANSLKPVAHAGFEYGFVLQGTLEIDVDGQTHSLRRGDLISYPSTCRHRVLNRGSVVSKAVWINLLRG